MSEPPHRDMRNVRLEALVRKALADAWAKGLTQNDAESMAVQIVRKVLPDIEETEIFSAIKALRG